VDEVAEMKKKRKKKDTSHVCDDACWEEWKRAVRRSAESQKVIDYHDKLHTDLAKLMKATKP
jgi:hypothetical protein